MGVVLLFVSAMTTFGDCTMIHDMDLTMILSSHTLAPSLQFRHLPIDMTYALPLSNAF
jgi:hypothetical protein